MNQDEGLAQDDVKRAAEMREWIEARILELEQELSRLRDMLVLVDNTLRQKSFVSAKELRGIPTIQEEPQTSRASAESSAPILKRVPAREARKPQEKSGSIETRQLRARDSELLATAKIESDKVVISPAQSVKLSSSIAPFQSFFVNRILNGYQSKDVEESRSGTLSPTDVMQYDIKEANGIITEIRITNYRDKSRLNEILNTATWAFGKMLEKK
jgi:hypothetical protein